MKKTPACIALFFLLGAPLCLAQADGELPPDDAVVKDPVPGVKDVSPDANVPPPIPVSDPVAKLKLVRKEAVAPLDTDLFSALKERPEFSMFVQLIDRAGASLALSQGGPFTVFAPTNEAFEALPDGARRSITTTMTPAQANKVLQRHLVEDALVADDLEAGELTAAAGNDLIVRVSEDGGTVSVDSATVVKSDLITSNGVLHSVNKVLLLSAE